LRARSFVESGQLVPDDVVNDIIAERFRGDAPPKRFVMDGYPRTLAQAASFDQVLRQEFLDLTAVLLLSLDDEEIIKRLSGRWSCPERLQGHLPYCQQAAASPRDLRRLRHPARPTGRRPRRDDPGAPGRVS